MIQNKFEKVLYFGNPQFLHRQKYECSILKNLKKCSLGMLLGFPKMLKQNKFSLKKFQMQ